MNVWALIATFALAPIFITALFSLGDRLQERYGPKIAVLIVVYIVMAYGGIMLWMTFNL